MREVTSETWKKGDGEYAPGYCHEGKRVIKIVGFTKIDREISKMEYEIICPPEKNDRTIYEAEVPSRMPFQVCGKDGLANLIKDYEAGDLP